MHTGGLCSAFSADSGARQGQFLHGKKSQAPKASKSSWTAIPPKGCFVVLLSSAVNSFQNQWKYFLWSYQATAFLPEHLSCEHTQSPWAQLRLHIWTILLWWELLGQGRALQGAPGTGRAATWLRQSPRELCQEQELLHRGGAFSSFAGDHRAAKGNFPCLEQGTGTVSLLRTF